MSTVNKCTIRQIYNGADLSEAVLNLPVTPYSEQFLSYKQKLDKALTDLKLLVQELINKEENKLDLSGVLEQVRSLNLSKDELCEGKVIIKDQIKNDKYFGVYLEIIQLEESKSSILECFIKWKNDHYYTRWDELSQPPQEMRQHWLKFKEKISKIILDSRKISSRPLPRLLVSESSSTQENSTLSNTLESVIEEKSVDEGKNAKEQDENEQENKILNVSEYQKESKGDSELIDEKKKGRKRQQREKGSSELWGPKTVPKSKNRYISVISTVRAIRKRTYNSNGRVRVNRDKVFEHENLIGEEKENILRNSDEQVRNLRKWERVEERRNEAKFSKYLLNNNEKRSQEGLKKEENELLRNPLIWSNNFSQACRDCFNTENHSEFDNNTLKLSMKIKEEVDLLNQEIGVEAKNDYLSRNNLETLQELCRQFLRENFGYEDFRKGQLEAIYSILLKSTENECFRKGSILILPTGYGKSLCFQFLSILMNIWFKKITLVITPLISLMQDQIRNLNKNIRGAVWNSSVSLEEKKTILQLIEKGSLDILYVTPESMFSTFLTKGVVIANQDHEDQNNRIVRLDLSKNKIALLCVDEAHCVCEWGHSFRPSYYSCIKYLIHNFKVERVLGITATAPSGMLDELKSLLSVGKVIQPHSNQKIQRENLHCKVLHLDSMKKKALISFNKSLGLNHTKVPKVYNNYSLIWDHIKYSLNSNSNNSHHNNGQVNATKSETCLNEKKKTRREVWSKCRNILIYVWQRSEVEAVTNYLRTKGANALYYHGMMSNSEREMVQKSFIENKTNIFVATTSFGMGIDKKDIDAVIHWNMPNSLEQYIQETGRCARVLDRLGICLLLLSDDDYRNKRQIISASLVDKTALRCLLHIILSRYDFSDCFDNRDDFQNTKIELQIFPIELFKVILNVKQVEEVETLLYYLKPYLDYLLRVKFKGNNIQSNWVSYIRGSPYLKIRCFDQDFSKIKENSRIFSSLSKFSTENSGVITINLLEASMNLGKNLEEIEEEIENERSVYKISVERLTNKQCVILGHCLIRNNTQAMDIEKSALKKDFQELFLKINKKESLTEDSQLSIIKENWMYILVEELHKELVSRNSDELWKLDIAYFSFQKFSIDKSCKDSIIESYFGNKRSELYFKLFNQEVDIIKNAEIIPSECLEGVSKKFVKDLIHGKLDKSMGDNTFEMMIQEIWISKWNQELLQDLSLGGKELVKLDSLVNSQLRENKSLGKVPNSEYNNLEKLIDRDLDRDQDQYQVQDQPKKSILENGEIKEAYQKINSCIKSAVSSLLSNYLIDLSPVQWETYRIAADRVMDHFSSKAQKELKKRRKEHCQKEDQLRFDFGQYLVFDDFDIIFPADIARILVGVTSFRYSYKAKGGLKKDYLDSNEVVSSKLWGKFKNIPYSVVLEICKESFKEMIKNKLSIIE